MAEERKLYEIESEFVDDGQGGRKNETTVVRRELTQVQHARLLAAVDHPHSGVVRVEEVSN